MVSSIAMFASQMKLDESLSKVYYEAKKDQLFSTYTIYGENKSLSGLITKKDGALSGELSINSANFKTDSSMRDSNVAEDLNSKAHPLITFIYKIKNNKAYGNMSVNGITKELSFPIVIKENESSLNIDGNISIKYTDFGIETPSNMILTAHDTLVIGANLVFVK